MTRHSDKRAALKEEWWPDEEVYDPPEKGWFKLARTLPLILGLLASKKVSGDVDPSRVYLELLSRHMDGGIVELGSEGDHAFASGYDSTRAVRTWQERMKALEQAGFIKTRGTKVQPYKYVLLVDPDVPIQKLNKSGKVPQEWMDTYKARQFETGEAMAPEVGEEPRRRK